MKFKKRIAPILAGALVGAIALTSTASAHMFDYWEGNYVGKSDAKILLRITTSAQTSLLNWNDVYSAGYNWNNISYNAEISLVYSSSGMPSLSEEMLVIGENLGNKVYGKTTPYNSSGYPNEALSYEDWSYAQITMNINPTVFNNASDPTAAARKTFLHEIGHTLKLCHPANDPNAYTHTINGLPNAIMNPGYPGSLNGATSATITSHDKTCVMWKWGY